MGEVWRILDEKEGEEIGSQWGDVVTYPNRDPSTVTEQFCSSSADFINGNTPGIFVLGWNDKLSAIRKFLTNEEVVIWTKRPPAPIAPANGPLAPAVWDVCLAPGVIAHRGDVVGLPGIDPSSIDSGSFMDFRGGISKGAIIQDAASDSLAELRKRTGQPTAVLYVKVGGAIPAPPDGQPAPFDPAHPTFLHTLSLKNGEWYEIEGKDMAGGKMPKIRTVHISRFADWKPSYHGQEAPLP